MPVVFPLSFFIFDVKGKVKEIRKIKMERKEREKLTVSVATSSSIDISQDNQDEDWDLYHDPEIVESLNRARQQMKDGDCIPAEIVMKDV